MSPSDRVIGLTVNVGPRELDRFQVFGERRSGTNYVERLLAKNTHLKKTQGYGWKHGVPAFPVFPLQCLFVVVVRDPLDWLRGFYRAPYEGGPGMLSLSFSEFIRREWEGIYTPLASSWAGHGYQLDTDVGRREPLQLDRHPITGLPFRNVVDMRNVKLRGHLSFLDRGLNAAVVRYSDVRSDPEGVLSDLRDAFDLSPRGAFKPIERSVGPGAFQDLDHAPTDADIDFVRREIDLDQERRCGFEI